MKTFKIHLYKLFAILMLFSVLLSPASKTAAAEYDPSEAPVFTDVPPDAYYAEGVAWAVENAITNGTTDTTFSPDDTCTNAQIITLLWRAKGSPVPYTTENPFADVSETDYFYQAVLWAYENRLVEDGSFNGALPCTRALTVTYLWKLAGMPSAPAADFTDVDNTARYALAVAWAVSEGITTGTGEGTFSPYDTCTRAQIVTFLYRALAE